MEQTIASQEMAQTKAASVPYPPSWIDKLMAWVARRPGPAWLYYLGVATLLYGAYLLVKWWEGGIPASARSPWAAMVTATGFYYLAAIHFRNDIAQDAMNRFRPVIEAPTWRVAELEYRLKTMNPKMVWFMLLLGLIEGITTLSALASGIISYPDLPIFASLPAVLLEATVIMFGALMHAVYIYHTIHQLQIVSRIYTEFTKVNLFQQIPLHAFARLTAYTAASWIIPQYFWLTAGLEANALGVAFSFFFLALLLAAITFTWPLLGIHRLLVAEKEAQQTLAYNRLQNCLVAFDQALERNELASIDLLSKAIDTTERECRLIDAQPTWPWQPGMIRGAVTAIFLPLLLWLMTRLLEQVI